MASLMGPILDGAITWLTRQALTCLQHIFGLIHATMLVSPDFTGLPQIQTLTGRSVDIIDTVFVLAFLAAGVLSMAAGSGERARYTVKDLIPRCVVGFIAAHFSDLIVHNMTLLGQGLTAAVVPGDLDQTGGLQALQTNLAAAGDPGVDVLMVVLLIVVCVLFVATIFQSLGRIMVLMVLTTMAPIALACHALPQTDPIARLWWRGFGSCLAIPIMQAFFLTAGQWLLLDPKNLLPVYGLQVEPGGVVNLLVVIVLLTVTVKIPKMLRRWVGQGGNAGGGVATLVRVIVVGGLSKAIPAAGRAGKLAR